MVGQFPKLRPLVTVSRVKNHRQGNRSTSDPYVSLLSDSVNMCTLFVFNWPSFEFFDPTFPAKPCPNWPVSLSPSFQFMQMPPGNSFFLIITECPVRGGPANQIFPRRTLFCTTAQLISPLLLSIAAHPSRTPGMRFVRPDASAGHPQRTRLPLPFPRLARVIQHEELLRRKLDSSQRLS